MKNISFFLLICAFIFSACKKEKAVVLVDCVPTDLQSNLIAFYPFSNGSLEDKSNFNNDLINTTQAVATSDRDGNLNCAYRFDNNNVDLEYLKTEQTGFLNNLPVMSVSLWYQPLDDARSDYETLIYRGEEAYNLYPIHENVNKKEWTLGLFDCRRPTFNHGPFVWARLVYPVTSTSCHDIIDLFTGNWQHLVVTKSGDTVKIYHNGIFQDESTDSSLNNNLSNIGDLFIGKSYTGEIDDVMIFNKELSQQEVTELFNLESCCD